MVSAAAAIFIAVSRSISKPIYKLLNSIGPHHKPIFKVGVKLKDSKFVYAQGNSKKESEQKAAKLFLKKIGL